MVGQESRYHVSNYGDVLSLNYARLGFAKQLAKKKDKKGYWWVTLCINKDACPKLIHAIVADTFLGHQQGLTVNHKDGNKDNNHVDNLEWVTQVENNMHMWEVLKYPHMRGGKHVHAKSFRVTSPSGEVSVIKGLKAFCLANGLAQCSMSSLANHRAGYSHHKGWRCEHWDG